MRIGSSGAALGPRRQDSRNSIDFFANLASWRSWRMIGRSEPLLHGPNQAREFGAWQVDRAPALRADARVAGVFVDGHAGKDIAQATEFVHDLRRRLVFVAHQL